MVERVAPTLADLADKLLSLQHLKLDEVAGLLQNADGPLEMTVPIDIALLLEVIALKVSFRRRAELMDVLVVCNLRPFLSLPNGPIRSPEQP